MKTFEVKTGHGYFKRISTNTIYCKAQLPKGMHPLQDDFEYVEVSSQTKLNKIVVDPEPLSEEVIWRQQVQEEIKIMAEERLSKKGIRKPVTL